MDDDLSCSGLKQRMRVAVKPSSLKSMVGILVRTPTPVTALWRRVTRATTLWRGENVAEEEDSTNGEDGSDEEVRERAG